MDTVVAERIGWRLVGPSAALQGFAFGSRYPTLVATVAGAALTAADRAAVTDVLREVAPAFDGSAAAPIIADDAPDEVRHTAEWLVVTMHALQRAAEVPVHEQGGVLFRNDGQATVHLPSTELAMPRLLRLLQALLAMMPAAAAGPEQRTQLAEVIAELTKTASIRSVNVPKFLRAAFDMGMPFQFLPGLVFQYGHGSRGRWLDSTFTDATPLMAGNLARAKHIAASLLRLAGVPAPDHFIVPSVEAALEAADRLGYPVVIKPADTDGGVGVSADLRSADEIPEAFTQARRHSAIVLVEKHFHGRDYRVFVMNDEVIWAHERVPGGVTGDGRRNVRELIDALNADPQRGDGPLAAFMRLHFDDEAAGLLRREGMSIDDVPAAGQFVRLRRTSSLRHAGMAVPAFENMHPDNRRLAVRATQALRLDIAGIDLLIPDITRSWRESGAAICDVNGQPGTRQVTAVDLPALILRKLVPGDGRVPTILLLGAASPGRLVREMELRLLRGGFVAGCHDGADAWVGGQTILHGGPTPYAAGRALCLDRKVGAIVLSINDDSLVHTGLPFPRFDMLVLAGGHIRALHPAPPAPSLQSMLEALLTMILPACDGEVLTVERNGLTLQGFERHTTAAWRHLPDDVDALATAVAEGSRRADARHQAIPQSAASPH